MHDSIPLDTWALGLFLGLAPALERVIGKISSLFLDSTLNAYYSDYNDLKIHRHVLLFRCFIIYFLQWTTLS